MKAFQKFISKPNRFVEKNTGSIVGVVERPEDLLGDAGLMKELKVALMERMLGAELTEHPGYEDGKDARLPA